ncbi:hypothetical protein BS47DRAFT_1357195 [Hydnum rufescens UP504]|uniref:Uncharacterized protein n=1 Tax=Hydnum rufescens UP504 TaxID=1448309 RepID=A0A9P6BAK0_9AGAM|nr:hypothetical protein BS47DRAFT_1357195 [Hydnum rufescens UP504]
MANSGTLNDDGFKGPMDSFVQCISKEEYDEKKALEFNAIHTHSLLISGEMTRKKNDSLKSNMSHERQKALQISLGFRDSSGKIIKAHRVPQLKIQCAKRQLSPIKGRHNQPEKPHVQSCHIYWFHLMWWSAISEAVICSKWQLTAAVKLLCKGCGGEEFQTLYASTLCNWMKGHSEGQQK